MKNNWWVRGSEKEVKGFSDSYEDVCVWGGRLCCRPLLHGRL